MLLSRLLFYIIALYVGYKFVFRFLIPIFVATYRLKGKVKEMNQQMKEEDEARSTYFSNPSSSGKMNTDNLGEYIDYEEIKK